MRILVNVLVMKTSLATSVNIVHLDTNIFLTVFHVTVVQMGLLIRIVIQILDIAIVMQELKEKNVATVWMDIIIFPFVKVKVFTFLKLPGFLPKNTYYLFDFLFKNVYVIIMDQ